MLFTRGTLQATARKGVFWSLWQLSACRKKKKMCSTLQNQQALFRFVSFTTPNLTRLGRDKFIYGLLINHQSLGGLLCEYLSV